MTDLAGMPVKTATDDELRRAVLNHTTALRKGDMLTLIYAGNIYVCDYEWAQKVLATRIAALEADLARERERVAALEDAIARVLSPAPGVRSLEPWAVGILTAARLVRRQAKRQGP